VRRLGHDRLVGGEPLQRVGRRARQEDRGELGGVEPRELGDAGALEEGSVEADVVADERRPVAEERAEAGDRVVRRWRAGEVGVADTGDAPDHPGERLTRIDEGDEAASLRERAVSRWREADRSDLDDAVDRRVEPGGLDVDRDQLFRRGLF
jgi:hypothetical protein